MNIIKTIGDPQEVPGRPEMNVDFFCCPGIGMAEASADELDRDAFFIQGRGEIMPQGMRPEPRYTRVPGKFFTQAVQTVS